MSQDRPSFLDSENFVMEFDNWHLTDDAPEELVKEFNAFMGYDDPEVVSGEKAL